MYLVCWNLNDRIVEKGSELNLFYSKVNNRYLNKYYGFALRNNIRDSLTFHLLPQSTIEKSKSTHAMLYRWFGTKDKTIEVGGMEVERSEIGQEYRIKYH